MYPLNTNCEDLPAAEVLLKYKYQPNLEKRHEQLKSVYAVAPAFLKDEGRIVALLLLYFLALLVQSLIERQVRTSMKAAKLEVLPLYPEERECYAPTANRILEVFEGVQRHDLMNGKTSTRASSPSSRHSSKTCCACSRYPVTFMAWQPSEWIPEGSLIHGNCPADVRKVSLKAVIG